MRPMDTTIFSLFRQARVCNPQPSRRGVEGSGYMNTPALYMWLAYTLLQIYHRQGLFLFLLMVMNRILMLKKSWYNEAWKFNQRNPKYRYHKEELLLSFQGIMERHQSLLVTTHREQFKLLKLLRLCCRRRPGQNTGIE